MWIMWRMRKKLKGSQTPRMGRYDVFDKLENFAVRRENVPAAGSNWIYQIEK